jgi:NAD(P)-dependent dehydrogenase (short-subunit alcohol dehydrogenase family)
MTGPFTATANRRPSSKNSQAQRIEGQKETNRETWFITGVSRGIGKALAEAALARGDAVIGTVRDGTPDIASEAGLLHILKLDVADAGAGAPTIEAAFEVTGRIEVLVNNAGYGLLGAIEEAEDDDVERLFAANVFGPFRVIRAALPRLR